MQTCFGAFSSPAFGLLLCCAADWSLLLCHQLWVGQPILAAAAFRGGLLLVSRNLMERRVSRTSPAPKRAPSATTRFIVRFRSRTPNRSGPEDSRSARASCGTGCRFRVPDERC